MKLRYALLAASLLAAPAAAGAEVNGLYMSLGGGFNSIATVQERQAYSGSLNPNPGFQINVDTPNGVSPYPAGPTYYDTQAVWIAAVGYGLTSNLRAEIETSYGMNRVTRLNNGLTPQGQGTEPLGLRYTGNEKKFAIMANVIWDFNDLAKILGSPVTPFVGVGIGLVAVDWAGVQRNGSGECFELDLTLCPNPTKNVPNIPYGVGVVQKITNQFYSTDIAWAAQGMAGVSYDIPGVPGLSLVADFRIFALPQGFTEHSRLTLVFYHLPAVSSPGVIAANYVLHGNGSSNFADEFNYRSTISLRYSFGAPPAPPPIVPVAAPVVPSAVSRSYLVFFDWDKATLTDRAKQIVAEAAAASTKVQVTKIEVNGYTDTSGTPKYNEGLSIARAKSVMAELVKDGVPASSIAVMGYGETHLLVPTGQGVREPQNRRVEIIIK
jgi:outer membrane protein OmpA-like peptidoglycan-associated protein/opacity protein-like surface antigen